MGAYSAGDLLGWDGNLVSYILQNFEANSAGTEQDELFDLVWNNNHSDFVAQLSSTCGMSLQDVLEKILAADGLSNELLNGLHSQNSTNFNNMFNSLLVGPPPPGPYPAGQISWLRSNVSDADLANAILSHYVNPMDIDAVLAMLSQILIEGAFSFGELIGFMECMNVPGLSNTLANNFSNQGLLHQLIVSNASQEYLLVLAMLNDPDFVKDVAENYSYLVAEAVRKLEGMSVEQYLALVKKHYGDGVMGDLLSALSGDLLFTKKFVLNEHHLYGSSRLGVKTHKRVLLRKEFSISGFEEDGTYIVDEVTDSLVYVASSEYFCRVLAQKQYELSNHLGNVLATVLDRRTGVFDETEDTLMYYVADVVSATLYYPFGSSMTSYKNPEFSYVYGFGGHEKVDEISGSGNHYTAEYWEMDPRLARRWNPDPVVKFHESPYAILANNPIWFVDPNGADTLDIMKNDAGKWIVSNTQIVEGDDVFRVKVGDETNSYTFSEGEYGKRVNVLNLENNDNYTLSIYHISGAEEGGTGYAVTPGGSASGEVNSNKRLPTDVYDLEASPNSGVIWRQPWVVRGENTGSVRSRGVKFHFGYTEPRKWTKGCFVISSDYDIQYGVIKYTQEQSRQAVRDFDRHLGATEVYNYKDKKKYTQIGAKFKKTKLDHKLILKDAF